MSTQAHPEEQLLELLIQLRKTTPEDARTILNAQPQIAYALIALMVKMDAVNVEVLQKTVASFGASAAPPPPPAPALPPHLQPPSQYRTPTPQTHAQTPPSASAYPPYSNGASTSTYAGQYAPPPPAAGHGGGTIPDALAAIPEEQKAMIMRVVTMTPDQINLLPPADRASIIQLRATLGLPSG